MANAFIETFLVVVTLGALIKLLPAAIARLVSPTIEIVYEEIRSKREKRNIYNMFCFEISIVIQLLKNDKYIVHLERAIDAIESGDSSLVAAELASATNCIPSIKLLSSIMPLYNSSSSSVGQLDDPKRAQIFLAYTKIYQFWINNESLLGRLSAETLPNDTKLTYIQTCVALYSEIQELSITYAP